MPEPSGGAQEDPQAATDLLHAAVAETLRELSGLGPDELRKDRYERFRRLGVIHGE
ncbi:hypothetical protein [Nonomuraea dietziae]|uniref:hypothetical protein n=1 Tax=Nonomuraea dietziae TaxID=65515 RepID=UPI003CD0833D